MKYFDPLAGPVELAQKFNENHDEQGRFASGAGARNATPDSLDDPKAKPLTPVARDARIKELGKQMNNNIRALNANPSLRDDKGWMSNATAVVSEHRNLVGAMAKDFNAEQEARYAELDNPEPPVQMIPFDASYEERHLIETPIKDTLSLSQGRGSEFHESSSNVDLLTFEDGSKGIWKSGEGLPDLREDIVNGYSPQREIAAWNVAKIVGMENNVAPVVQRTINGKDGTVAGFAEGQVARSAGQTVAYDGNDPTFLGRAAMFDYVIGNLDRNGANWIVDSTGHATLVDHNLAFPDVPRENFWMFSGAASAFLNEAARRSRFGAFAPPAGPPETYAKPYIDNEEKILATIKQNGLTEGAVDSVKQRIDRLKLPAKWTDFA